MWFFKLIRQFFYMIDNIVYNGIIEVYRLLIDISRTSVLSQSSIQSMANRIYQLLAVFMAFKIIFSLIMYVVNPDDFSDKSKGVSKLGLNVVITLSLLILTPYIFSYAFQLQNIILEDNSIGTLVFGNTEEEDPGFSIFSTAGTDIAFYTIRPFLIPNAAIKQLKECSTLEENGVFNKDCSGIDFDSSKDDQYTGSENSLAGLANGKEYEATYTLIDVKNYVFGYEKRSLGLLFRPEIILGTAKIGEDNEFVMDYKFMFSTPIGIIVLLLLISFCMDVALRSVKLSFLQLIAPIPILSYLDPKSGKDGMFKKWYQICLKTYASLFVRLLALYFAVFIITKINKISDVLSGAYQSSILIQVFIIIGTLMFAKQLPKILEGLGVKLDGDGKFIVNPIKKFDEQALGGKRITGAAGAMTAGLVDRGARAFTTPGAWGKAKALLGTPAGLIGSGIRGAKSNAGFSGGMSRQADVNRRLRESRMKGLTPASAYLDYVGSQFGLDDATLEKEGTLTQKNKSAIAVANREIAADTRDNELSIAQEQQRLKPLKSIADRRNSVQTAGEKLKASAEDFAGKKADFNRTSEDLMHISAIDKMKRGDTTSLTTEEREYLNSSGVSTETIAPGDKAALASRDLSLAKLSRTANRNQYTTNRRTDAANVEFLQNNQGKELERSIVIGEGDSQLALPIGTKIDGEIVARAQAAQGRYIKQSQKEVYNELAKREGSEYSNTGDYSSFQSDYNGYDEAKRLANREIQAYSGNNPYENMEIGTVGEDRRDYDEIDSTINKIKSGDDTTNINAAINESNSEIERMEKENADTKANKTVTYYDEKGKKIKNKSLAEAESESKPREEAYKDDVEKHQERRSLWKSMSSGKK